MTLWFCCTAEKKLFNVILLRFICVWLVPELFFSEEKLSMDSFNCNFYTELVAVNNWTVGSFDATGFTQPPSLPPTRQLVFVTDSGSDDHIQATLVNVCVTVWSCVCTRYKTVNGFSRYTVALHLFRFWHRLFPSDKLPYVLWNSHIASGCQRYVHNIPRARMTLLADAFRVPFVGCTSLLAGCRWQSSIAAVRGEGMEKVLILLLPEQLLLWF